MEEILEGAEARSALTSDLEESRICLMIVDDIVTMKLVVRLR